MALEPVRQRLQLSDPVVRGNAGVTDGLACDDWPGTHGGAHRVMLVSPMASGSPAETHQQALPMPAPQRACRYTQFCRRLAN
ncbi:hypothetical protein B0G81_2278 [Paraburkholderia sp. BL6665CI2N2]|uniref:hypothetical protein n=1 Tax=Paraburkholderia sp. BL6665CI2N2 TaxID=1938806 RepID=UPI0010D37A05|nr:hypothetical protein [Paraburkholderia sp. BL6665CI2N2]TDY22009.1 hypothetical protein B0G81_2278 [Paraburkholderia sp. BL6665CI2N2]